MDPTNDNVWFIGAGTFWDVKRFHRTAANKTGGAFRPKAILGHIYKSTNKGNTWKKITTGLPNKLAVSKIIVDPRNPNKVIMAANTGLYLSTDKGESWTLSQNNGLPNSLPKDMVSHYNETTNKFTLFLVDQTSFSKSGNTYTSQGGIYKSTNGGQNWTSITGDLGIDLTKITSNSAKYYFKRSVAKWLGINVNNVGDNYPSDILQNYNRIVVNPKNANEIYISHNVKHDFSFGPGDVWKTDNGGQNWYPCARSGKYWAAGTNQGYWNSKAEQVSGKNTTYAHLQHEMDIREEIWGCRFLSINPDGDVFISLDQQVLKSSNGGSSWQQIDDDESSAGSKSWINRGNSNLPGRYIYLETGVEDRKFFLSGEHGLWESTDLGDFSGTDKVATKQIEGQVNSGGAHSTATLAVHPNNPDIIYTLQFRQNHRNYFRSSTDGGETWENIGKPFNHPEANQSSEHIYSSSLMVDPQNPSNIYFTAMRFSPSEINEGRDHSFDAYGVYKSTDGGKNWAIKNTGFPAKSSIRRLEMHPTNSNTIYAASNTYNGVTGGLYKTTNKAASWSKVTIPSSIKSVNNVHIDPTTHDIYISCGTFSGVDNAGGVWRSKDDGQTWSKIFGLNYVWQAETSPLDPNIIVVTVPKSTRHKNPGAYISRDGGKSWVKVNKNLAHAHAITDIKPDNKDKNTFWCAGWGSGWYKGVFDSEMLAIAFHELPPSIEQSQTFSVDVNYTVSKQQQISVVFTDPSGAYISNSQTIVEKGTGTVTIELNLNNLPPIDEKYVLTTSVRPIGGNYGSALVRDQARIDIVEPLPDSDVTEFIGLPASMFQTTTFNVTVRYEATAQRDISVVMRTPAGQYMTNTRQTVDAGIGEVTLTMNLNDLPPPGMDYELDATIRLVGGGYADNTFARAELIEIKDATITSLEEDLTSSSPYPTYTQGNVHLPKKENGWTLYDLAGSELLRTTETFIKLDELPNGLYFLSSGDEITRIVLNK